MKRGGQTSMALLLRDGEVTCSRMPKLAFSFILLGTLCIVVNRNSRGEILLSLLETTIESLEPLG